jgi:UDP-2,3-diacylglucosamine hydrolase
MDAATPRFAVLNAAAHWHVIDFISDLHLQNGEPSTAQAWADYMARTRADAVFILGDLFEVWVGDDELDADDTEARFEQQCAAVLRTASRSRDVFLMHGNRDFLLGARFAQATGVALLNDPTLLVVGDQRWLLSHGDTLCLEDTEYLRFRDQVRAPSWQENFLARPLPERRAFARDLRQKSEARKHGSVPYADVDDGMVTAWLAAASATQMIHGHTHKPANHDLGAGLQRLVLSDWDAAATPPRAEVLRLSRPEMEGPLRVQRLAASKAG